MDDNKMVELLKSRFHIEAERNDRAFHHVANGYPIGEYKNRRIENWGLSNNPLHKQMEEIRGRFLVSVVK